jgi:hypothetical protein
MYSTDDLKNLGDFLKLTAEEAKKKDPPQQQDFEDLMTFYRQLEAIRFNPLIFKTILNSYEVNYSLMEEPLKKVALHINDAGIISKTIVQWRCTNAL